MSRNNEMRDRLRKHFAAARTTITRDHAAVLTLVEQAFHILLEDDEAMQNQAATNQQFASVRNVPDAPEAPYEPRIPGMVEASRHEDHLAAGGPAASPIF